MMRIGLFIIGLLMCIIGLLHPLGIVESTIIEYILYIGIVAFGIGILLLPGKSEA